MRQKPMAFAYDLRPSRLVERQPAAAAQLVKSLLNSFGNTEIALDLVAEDQRIYYRLVTFGDAPITDVETLQSLISVSWPDVVVEATGEVDIPEGTYRLSVYYETHLHFPFFEVVDVRNLKTDYLVALTNSFNQLLSGERAVFRILCSRTYGADWEGLRGIVNDPIGTLFKSLAPSSGEQEQIRHKLNGKLSRVVMGMEFETGHTKRVEAFWAMADLVCQLSHPARSNLYRAGYDDVYTAQAEVRSKAQALGSLWEQFGEKARHRPYNVMLFSPFEIATLWRFPDTDFTASKLDAMGTLQVEMPEAVQQISEGLLVGVNRYGPKEHPFKIPLEDRKTHTLIIGKNGTGKSSLMLRMLYEDMQAGRGVCVIDPHHELVRDVLKRCIAEGRQDDVVLLDVSNRIDGKSVPPPLNLVSISPRNLVEVMSRVDTRFAGSQMADDLDLALTLLEVEKDPTLFDVRRVFQDVPYRRKLLKKAEDIDAIMQWEEFDNQSESEQRRRIRPLLRRLGQMYKRNEIAAITCNPQPFRIFDWIEANKIILVSLGAEGNQLGLAERRIIGTAILSEIENAAFEGAVEDIEHKPFMVYIDETQNYETTSLPRMLAEVRKYGVGLVMANQYLFQLSEGMQKAVDGNVGTIFCFEIGQNDARLMQHYTKPQVGAEQLMRLGKFRAVVNMRYQGERQPAFTLETLPPPEPEQEQPADEWAMQLRKRSAKNLELLTYDEVVDVLKRRYVGNHSQSADDEDHTADDNGDPGFYE